MPRETQAGSANPDLGRLGLGVAPIAHLYTPVSDEAAQATLRAAQESHIRWFDVAPLYGFGLAEERVGSYLRESDGPRPILSTKVGRLLEPTDTLQVHDQFVGPLHHRVVFDYSRSGIERSYEQSLRRLGVERVNLLLLHDIDQVTHRTGHRALVKQIFNESLPTLARLKSERCVDAIGLGINEWDIGYEVLVGAEVDYVLLAGRYTLLDQSAFTSGFLDSCARRDVPVLAAGVFNGGFLAGGSRCNYVAPSAELLARRGRLNALCQRYGVTLANAALQYTAAHPAIASVLVGARSAAEVGSMVAGSRASIPGELWQALRASELIPQEAPTPQ